MKAVVSSLGKQGASGGAVYFSSFESHALGSFVKPCVGLKRVLHAGRGLDFGIGKSSCYSASCLP